MGGVHPAPGRLAGPRDCGKGGPVVQQAVQKPCPHAQGAEREGRVPRRAAHQQGQLLCDQGGQVDHSFQSRRDQQGQEGAPLQVQRCVLCGVGNISHVDQNQVQADGGKGQGRGRRPVRHPVLLDVPQEDQPPEDRGGRRGRAAVDRRGGCKVRGRNARHGRHEAEGLVPLRAQAAPVRQLQEGHPQDRSRVRRGQQKGHTPQEDERIRGGGAAPARLPPRRGEGEHGEKPEHDTGGGGHCCVRRGRGRRRVVRDSRKGRDGAARARSDKLLCTPRARQPDGRC